ncbi:acyl-CoA synthetase (AMP-forming)/AMP-acid ligase II [Pseudorhizobium tarimense]|uniref:Acyl-CoA synthetase (AMP-forming)/AMP-acid ligase II n=1 Tax=Pseudorhizobium tarimense TaxID=1079109 RepID=A0ABV2H9J0_9HYPH|nr:class I adenylate-forming enzyme family protein [Pseudorhizobium tarimense]MCJ8520461.1 acyl--CoA ligase [Pseudorhizobium tarimense]
MRIEARLQASAERFPWKTAVAAGGRRLSYADLADQSDRLARALLQFKVSAGDRIVLILDNDIEAPLSFFATWKAGAVACPLSPSIKAAKLADILVSTTPAVVIVHGRYLATVRSAMVAADSQAAVIVCQAPSLPEDTLTFEDLIVPEINETLAVRTEDEALALLIHTSGSTGRPKGVMLTHANVDVACQSITGYLGNTCDDVVLSVLPLSFGYGITQMLTMAGVGGTLVLERSFAFPRKILDRLVEERVTGFPMVPAMAAMLTGMKDLSADLLPDLRYVTTAAAALPPALSSRLKEMLPETDVFVMYGQTECLRISFLPPDLLAKRPTSVGKAIPGTRAYVVDETGQRAAPGVVGELVVEGPHVMAGYWGDQAGSSSAVEIAGTVRRLRTGDLFFSDEEGFLHFVSRSDDIIKTRGEKVSPQEVERVLYALEGIREAAVTGVDDAIFGQVVRAHVALQPSFALSERDIIRHCATHLEDYMVPKSVEFRDGLPRTATGKIRMSAGGEAEPQLENVP